MLQMILEILSEWKPKYGEISKVSVIRINTIWSLSIDMNGFYINKCIDRPPIKEIFIQELNKEVEQNYIERLKRRTNVE